MKVNSTKNRYKNVASIRFVASVIYKVDITILQWQFKVMLYAFSSSIQDFAHYKTFRVHWTGFHVLTRNSKHIVLRSAMAFKKFGKEPFNRRTRYISFTINLLNLGHHAVVQTGGIYNQLNLWLCDFFLMFGGEVRTLRVGYLNEIELTNIELDTKVHAFDHTILPVCDFSVVSESNTTGNSYAEDFCGGFTSIIIRPANFGHFCTNATELLLNNWVDDDDIDSYMIERLKSHVEVRNKIYKKTSPVTYIHYEDVDSIGDFLRASYCMHCGNPRRGLRLCDCCKQDHELTVNQQYVIRPHSISKFDNYEIMSKINELFKPAAVDDVYIERGYTKLELVCEEIGVTNILLQRNCCIDKNRIALLRIQRFSNFNFEIGASVAAIGRYVGDGESHDVAIINNATKLHPFEWRLSNKFGTRGDKTVETSTAWRDVLDDAPLDDHVSAGRDVALELNTSHLHDDSTALATRLGEQSNSLTRVDTFDVELSGRAGVSKGVSIFNMLSGYGITSNNFTTEGAFKMISYNHAPQSNNVAVDDGSVDIFNTIYRYFKRKLSREYTSLFDYNRLINYCVFDSNTAYGLLLCADIAMVSPVDNNVTYCIDANYIYGTRQHFKQLFVQPWHYHLRILFDNGELTMAWLNINGNCGTFDRYYNLLRYRTRKLVWGSFGPFDYKFSQQGNTVVNAVGRSDSSDTNAVQRLVVENTSTAAYKDITVDVSELCCTTSNNMYTFGYTIPLDHDGVVSSNQVLYEYTNDATTTHCFDAKPSLSLKGIRRSGTAHMAVHDINVPAGVDRRTVRKRTGKGLKRLINANKTSGGFVWRKSIESSLSLIMDGVPVWNEIAATGVERTSSSASDETTSEGAILDDTLNTLDEHNSSALVVAQFNTDTANTAAAVVGSDINCSGPDKSPTAIAQSRLTESITQLIRAELMDGCVVFNINSRHDEFFEFYETATTAGDIAVNSKDLGEIFDTYTVPKMSKAEAIEFAVRFELIRRTAQKRPLGDIDEIRGSIEAAFDKRTFHKLELTHRGVRSMAVSESTSDDSVTEGSEYLNKLELPFKDGVTISSWVDADDAYYYTPIDGDVGFTAHVKPWYAYSGEISILSYEFIVQLQSISDNPAFTQYRNINSMIFEDCIHALPGTFVESWRKQQFDPKYLLALYRGDFKTVGNAELVEPYVGAAKKIRWRTLNLIFRDEAAKDQKRLGTEHVESFSKKNQPIKYKLPTNTISEGLPIQIYGDFEWSLRSVVIASSKKFQFFELLSLFFLKLCINQLRELASVSNLCKLYNLFVTFMELPYESEHAERARLEQLPVESAIAERRRKGDLGWSKHKWNEGKFIQSLHRGLKIFKTRVLTRPDVRYVRGYIVSVADQPSLNDMISKIVTSGRLDVIKFLNLRRELTLLTLGNSIDEVVIEYDCLQSPAQLSDTLLNNASVDTQISYGDLDSVGSEFTVYSSQRNYTQQEITELLVCDTLHIYESLPKVGILYSSRIGNWVEASKYVGSVFAACLGYTSDLDGPTTDDESSETVDIFTITSEISNLWVPRTSSATAEFAASARNALSTGKTVLFRWQSRVFKISYVSGIFLYGEIYNVTKLDNLGALPSLDEFAERLGISFVVQEHNTTTELAADSAVSYLNTFKFSNNVLFTLNSYDDCCDNELEYLLDWNSVYAPTAVYFLERLQLLANKAIDCRVNIVSGFIGAGNDKLFIEDSLRRSEILSKLVINFTTELLSDPSVVELISCFIVEAFTLNLLNVSKFTELLSNVVTSKINNLPGAVRFDFLMQLCDIHSYIMRIYVGGMPVVVDNLLTNLFGIPSKNKFKQLRIGQQYCTDCNPKTLYDVCDVFDAAVVESSTDDEPSQFNVGSYKKLQGDLIVSDGEYSGMSGALGLLEDLISSEATSDFEIDAQAIESEQSAPENAAPLHKSAIQKQSISEDTTEGRIIGLFNSALLKCTRRAMKLARVGGTESTIDGLVARCSKMLNLNRTNGNIYDIFESVVEFAISPSISDTLQSITAAQELLIPSNALFNETLFETPHNKYTFNSLRAIATSSQNTDNFDEVVSDGVDTNLQTLYAVYPMLWSGNKRWNWSVYTLTKEAIGLLLNRDFILLERDSIGESILSEVSKFYDIAVSGSSDDENAQPTREHVKTRRNAVSLFSERIPKTTLSDDTTDEWSDLAIVNKTEDVGDQSVIGEFTDEINIELLDKNSSHNESSSGVDALANKPSDTNYENNAEQLVDPAVSSLTGLASATRGGAAEPAVSSSTEVASPIKPAIEPYVFKSVLLRINSIDLSVSIRVDAPVGEIITWLEYPHLTELTAKQWGVYNAVATTDWIGVQPPRTQIHHSVDMSEFVETD